MGHNHRYLQVKNITLVGAGINTLLGIIKVLGGLFFYSHALIADGLHSFSDLFTDMMVLFASKYGSQDADEGHPYGHQRIETAATLMLAMLLILAGVGIAWDSLSHIVSHSIQMPSALALPIALLSIVANELMFFITKRVGQQVKSALLIANAWHHRSDSAASGIVLFGLIGSLFGFTAMDPIAATLVGCLIIKMGISYGWDSVKELVDTGVEPAQVIEIKRVIQAVDGVCKIHQLRNRTMGSDLFVDVHILVSPYISVSEGHQIAQHVHFNLMQAIEHIKDVTVHVDPEDDELSSPSRDLPSRRVLDETVLHGWSQRFPEIKSYVIHYLEETIMIEVRVEDHFQQWSALQEMVRQDLTKQPKIVSICLLRQTDVDLSAKDAS